MFNPPLPGFPPSDPRWPRREAIQNREDSAADGPPVLHPRDQIGRHGRRQQRRNRRQDPGKHSCDDVKTQVSLAARTSRPG